MSEYTSPKHNLVASTMQILDAAFYEASVTGADTVACSCACGYTGCAGGGSGSDIANL